MSEVAEQIDEMLKMYDMPGPTDESVEETEEVVEEVIEETSEENKEDETTEEIKEEPQPTTPDPEDKFESLKREHEEFKLKLDEILNRKPEEKKEVVVPEQITEQDFLEGEDIDNIINDSSAFNKLLNKVFLKGVEIANKRQEEIKNTLPETIRNNVVSIEKIRDASNKFYNENKDLVPFKKAVATVYNELAEENPTWDMNKLLKESEVETRKRLNIVKPDNSKSTEKNDVPSLPRKRSQPRSTPSTKPIDPLVSDIEAMNAVLYK